MANDRDGEQPAAVRAPDAGMPTEETDAVSERAGEPNGGNGSSQAGRQVAGWSGVDRRDQAWLRQMVFDALHGSWALFVRFVILVILAVVVLYLWQR